MRRAACFWILGFFAVCWPPPAAASLPTPDACATTEFDGIFRLADDPKGRRYLVRFRDAARPIAGTGTFRLDTRDAHIVAPFDGMMTIVRAPLENDVLAASIVSIRAYGRDMPCPLRATPVQDLAPLSEGAIVPHTRTFDAVPIVDGPMTCERPFVEGSADHGVAIPAPPIARQQGIGGIVVVSVLLDEKGSPTDARIESSPSPILNAFALAAARGMTYAPAIYRCVPSPQGRALFKIDFMTRG